MKLSDRRLWVGGGLLTAALLVLLGWLVWPEKPTQTKGLVVARGAKPVAAQQQEDAPIPQFKEPKDVLEELGIDPKVTPHCAIINQWAARNVPGWVILKNVDAQAMFFDENELACLTASPLPGGIVEAAEQRVRVQQPPGVRNFGGKPPPPPGG